MSEDFFSVIIVYETFLPRNYYDYFLLTMIKMEFVLKKCIKYIRKLTHILVWCVYLFKLMPKEEEI